MCLYLKNVTLGLWAGKEKQSGVMRSRVEKVGQSKYIEWYRLCRTGKVYGYSTKHGIHIGKAGSNWVDVFWI